MRLAKKKVTVNKDRLTDLAKTWLHHLNSLWLFTISDIKTIIAPSFVFGIANALASANYGLRSPHATNITIILWRTPVVLLYIWMNLLPFTINNQKNPRAILEDEINKPWRTLPSKRMTPIQAGRLMMVLYVIAVVLSYITGGFRQSTALLLLGVWYNNLGGGDSSFVVRNLINAGGYVCFLSGAMEVALGFSLPMRTSLTRWFAVLASIILTTVHLQDMYDQAGDRMRGRKTVPLVIGDRLTRWTNAISMMIWGYACPRLWNSDTSIMVLSLLLAGTVAGRGLFLTLVEQDRSTFRIWNVWMSFMFLLPLLNQVNM